MSERRRHERRSCSELINITTDTRKNRAGLMRDVSAAGVCFQSASRFAVGERLDIYIESRSLGRMNVVGRVVWSATAPQHHSVFPHCAAIELDHPRVELVAAAPADRGSALDIAKLI